MDFHVLFMVLFLGARVFAGFRWFVKKTCKFVGVLTGKENDDPGSSRQYFVLVLSTVVVAVAVGLGREWVLCWS